MRQPPRRFPCCFRSRCGPTPRRVRSVWPPAGWSRNWSYSPRRYASAPGRFAAPPLDRLTSLVVVPSLRVGIGDRPGRLRTAPLRMILSLIEKRIGMKKVFALSPQELLFLWIWTFRLVFVNFLRFVTPVLKRCRCHFLYYQENISKKIVLLLIFRSKIL